MSETFNRFEIYSENKNPGGTTIIKVVDVFNPKITIGFGVCDNTDGKIIIGDIKNSTTLLDLLHYLQDQKSNISWSMDI